ncbi:MAG: polysaccharide pyruvyl transferase family protein [Clostridium sp.]|nr:polysaccharide pyruvyl transferase family protein [Clostridium sp.]MDU7084331.1 polysaccharide pyruvyl transferase family protein [Clostridium sp.]
MVEIQALFYSCIKSQNNITISSNKRTIFLLLSTDYSNLGDHAMTYAHIKLLKKEFPESEIKEVLVGDTLRNIPYMVRNIKPNDVITLKGGGNIGIEYFREELIRRKILKKFPNNKIILFPQTVYFPDTFIGKKEFNNTIKAFNNHKYFYAFFRDKISYELMKKHINNNVFITPDIALSLGKISIDKKRCGVVTCLRSDVEGIYSEDSKDGLIKILNEKFTKITITDTIKDYFIETKNREKELLDIWELFSESELVITDRLHGMIFAALTSTPCIVFKTYNHKLTGQFEWLKDLNYIKNINMEENEVNKAIFELLNCEIKPIKANLFDEYFNNIIESIKKSEDIQ